MCRLGTLLRQVRLSNISMYLRREEMDAREREREMEGRDASLSGS
jgi:hypothetical protein